MILYRQLHLHILYHKIWRLYYKVPPLIKQNLHSLDKPVKVEVEVGIPKIYQKSTGGFAVEESRLAFGPFPVAFWNDPVDSSVR